MPKNQPKETNQIGGGESASEKEAPVKPKKEATEESATHETKEEKEREEKPKEKEEKVKKKKKGIQEQKKQKKRKRKKVKQKDELTEEIEGILEEGLEDAYQELTPVQQQEFKMKGEETAKKIKGLIEKGKTKVKKIFELIFDWLKTLPGVNKYFLEQEAKIKADKISKLEQKEQKQAPSEQQEGVTIKEE